MRRFRDIVTEVGAVGALFFVGRNRQYIEQHPAHYIPNLFPGVDTETFIFWWHKTRTPGKEKFGIYQLDLTTGNTGEGKLAFYTVGIALPPGTAPESIMRKGTPLMLSLLLRNRRRGEQEVLALDSPPGPPVASASRGVTFE